MDKKEENRRIIQEKGVELSHLHPLICFEYSTGLGKTYQALKCVEASDSNKKWLWIVPEVQMIENFLQDMEKHNYSHLLNDKIERVICYASLFKFQGLDYNLVLDECHRIQSSIRLEVVKNIYPDHVIGLSATISNKIKERFKEIGNFHYEQITLSQAIELEILPTPEINIIRIELDDKEKLYPFKIKCKKDVLLTAVGHYKKLCGTVDYWKKKVDSEGLEWQRRKWFMSALVRKRFISSYKTDILKKLIEYIGNQRFICFCGSVEQAKAVGNRNAIHSKNSTTFNSQLIQDFNDEKIDRIFTCQMLKEGMNFKECPIGIITQLDGETLSAIQICGRTLRSSEPKLYVIVIKDTQDEKYLNNFLKEIDNKYIKEIEI